MVARGVPDAALAERLRAAGQEHLVAHARALPDGNRPAFVAELESVAWERVAAALRSAPIPPPPELRPPEALTWRRQQNEAGILRRLGGVGEAMLAAGKVATVLLAGGQGTRLGHPGPKGTFVFGPTPDRTLYAILCERVAATATRHGRRIPLVVLTSPDTDEATRAEFAGRGFYGLDPSMVRFVRQGVLPAVDDEGKAILCAPGRLALSPDGHGGLVHALARSGTLDWLQSSGVEWFTTFQVDNPLSRPLDPVFLGWTVERRAVAAGKAVRKREPAEKVGVFARDLEGRVRIVEYSEAPPEAYPDLVLGSIAIHAFSLPWLRSLVAEPGFTLPLHRARKKVPFLGPDGTTCSPAAENGTKLEQFLFDLLPMAPRVAVHEVDRRREFAPVKNAAGDDSPDTARALVAAEVARWHKVVGIPVPDPVPALRPKDYDGPEDLLAGARKAGG